MLHLSGKCTFVKIKFDRYNVIFSRKKNLFAKRNGRSLCGLTGDTILLICLLKQQIKEDVQFDPL